MYRAILPGPDPQARNAAAALAYPENGICPADGDKLTKRGWESHRASKSCGKYSIDADNAFHWSCKDPECKANGYFVKDKKGNIDRDSLNIHFNKKLNVVDGRKSKRGGEPRQYETPHERCIRETRQRAAAGISQVGGQGGSAAHGAQAALASFAAEGVNRKAQVQCPKNSCLMYISAGQLKTHQAGIACGANLAKENWEALNGVRQVRCTHCNGKVQRKGPSMIKHRDTAKCQSSRQN